jgi:hypothetical protein
MIEDGTLVGKDDVSSPEADEQGALSQASAFYDGPPTLPRPSQGRTEPHRPLTGRSHCYHLR